MLLLFFRTAPQIYKARRFLSTSTVKIISRNRQVLSGAIKRKFWDLSKERL
jgi:hypothetical protein